MTGRRLDLADSERAAIALAYAHGENASALAVCAQVDPELFFPGKGESTAPAKRVCRGCPVKAECLEWALANTMSHGVWGGQSDQERKRLGRRGAA